MRGVDLPPDNGYSRGLLMGFLLAGLVATVAALLFVAYLAGGIWGKE
jgi:hypothetical protein